MIIYVKSFNRAFYLDRCLRSIKLNVSGYSKIVILDDGTETRFIDKIAALHPDVEIRGSGADDFKFELLRQEKFAEVARHYPSSVEFWVREIARDTGKFCVVVEDDVWFTRCVDLILMADNLDSNEAVLGKFWWASYPHEVTASYSAGGLPTIDYYEAKYGSLTEAETIWIVAFAMFRRDYWLRCVSKAKRLGDERSQLAAACEFAASHPSVKFAKMRERCIYQGWIVPARSTPEYYERGLRQHLYIDALNSAWLDGQFDPWTGYPFDFPIEQVADILTRYIPLPSVRIWQEWHAREISYFYS